MANQSSAKGNPASTRMSNKNRGIRRGNSWARGKTRSDARRVAQAERARANVRTRRDGGQTAWEISRAARAARRDKDPDVLRREAQHAMRRQDALAKEY